MRRVAGEAPGARKGAHMPASGLIGGPGMPAMPCSPESPYRNAQLLGFRLWTDRPNGESCGSEGEDRGVAPLVGGSELAAQRGDFRFRTGRAPVAAADVEVSGGAFASGPGE